MSGGATPPVERIGLLFVHGIGEQARFEHLAASVGELAEMIGQAEAEARVSIVDRTAGWAFPPGEPDPAGTAPMTLSLRSPGKRIDFECHEVWWADLGGRAGLLDALRFWLWGLGQWAAPIYREVDASRLGKDDGASSTKRTSSFVKLPKGIVGTPAEVQARWKLMLAALGAALTAVSWGLAKRIAAALLGQAPSPTLIVQYIGDVRTYTEPGGPGQGSPTDPGHPRRVGIRRRMVREMLAMAAKPGPLRLDGWYVLAHSLGTVLAYNGLAEIGHTLPNYLTEAQWQALPPALKRDPECRRRTDLHNMMPARPPWLEDEDVINRPLLFADLRGLFTYGSPLGKFAALWPRIVATATDREEPTKSAFPESCRWINFVAPQDPVAGRLDAFQPGGDSLLPPVIPAPQDVRTPFRCDLLLAHIRYLTPEGRPESGTRSEQKVALANWLTGRDVAFRTAPPTASDSRWIVIGYAAMLTGLWLATTLLVASAVTVAGAARAGTEFAVASIRLLAPVGGSALMLIAIGGLARWRSESCTSLRLARAERTAASGPEVTEQKDYWNTVIEGMEGHVRSSRLLWLWVGLLCLAAAWDWGVALYGAGPWRWLCWAQIVVALVRIDYAVRAQTRINAGHSAAVAKKDQPSSAADVPHEGTAG